MKNKAKFKTDCEAREAYKKWCRERVKRGLKCNNECTFCFDDWLDKEEGDYGDAFCINDEWYWRVEFELGCEEDGDEEL